VKLSAEEPLSTTPWMCLRFFACFRCTFVLQVLVLSLTEYLSNGSNVNSQTGKWIPRDGWIQLQSASLPRELHIFTGQSPPPQISKQLLEMLHANSCSYAVALILLCW
jgi:hypothetical protein